MRNEVNLRTLLTLRGQGWYYPCKDPSAKRPEKAAFLLMNKYCIRYDRYGQPESVLHLQTLAQMALSTGLVRASMRYAPVNPSDLIPVTGAYRHRTRLPCVAGYEGVATVTDVSPGFERWSGQRILPLRGEGTWQTALDLDSRWLVAVPDDIDDTLAARGYINPLTALLMLRRWPVRDKRVVLTAASSSCAGLLAQWALRMGARSVSGVIRSPAHVERLTRLGVCPVMAQDLATLQLISHEADLVFDAVGGELATLMLQALSPNASLISYGLLSGQPVSYRRGQAKVVKFHLREALPQLDERAWQAAFNELWRLLPQTVLPPVRIIPWRQWRLALEAVREVGRAEKILLDFAQ